MRQRLKRLACLALLAGLLAPLGASAVTPPTVLSAGPGLDGRAIARFTLRFSEAMTPLGAQRRAPIAMACDTKGSGRWVDTTTYVWEFEKPLPAGATCRAALLPTARTLAGRPLTGQRSFAIDAGGPFATEILPTEGDEDIEEDQAYLVATNGPVDRASVAAGAYCAVEGIGERIAVDVIAPGVTERVVLSLSRYERDRLLAAVSDDGEAPDDAAAQKAGAAKIVGLKCRRPLPPGHDMSLVWGASIRSPAGRTAGADQRFDYTVRKEFSARLTCGRVNPQAGCDPVEPVKVEFSAPVPRAQALAVRIEAAGRSIAPTTDDKGEGVSTLRFKPPLPPGVTAKLVVPAGLRDISGRPLANARRFPLDFAIDQPPPLVKFAAPFGILEAKQGGVLPVTVRGVEPALAQSVQAVGGSAARIEGDEGTIAKWLRTIEKAQREDYREERRGKAKVTVNHTGDRPVLGPRAGASVKRLQMALPGKGRQFEVVGIPLSSPGFYVVELASPTLGRALLGRPATRYVAAAALVTDLSVHFKWGRADSLAWVTSLDSGAPVAGATVRVADSCSGRLLASGTTDSQGRLLIHAGLPEPSTASGCDPASAEAPLIVSARSGGDFSFVLTSWNQGIAPYDFSLDYGYNAPEPVFHTVFDRTLVRAGETVHMKHVWRAQTPAGFRSGGSLKGTLVLQHRGSDTAYELPVTLGPDGIGETEWEAPKDAPGGDYDLRLKLGEKVVYTGQSFRVDEYRLPTMRASVAGPKARLARPRRLPLDLFVGYLSGGGAGGAPVKLRTEYESLYDSPSEWEGWTFGGAQVREGTTPLDDENEEADDGARVPASATLPLTLGKDGALRTELDVPELQQSLRLRVEMDYEDANGETLTTGTSIPLYASAVRLGIRPDGWIQRSRDMRLKVVALDLDGKVIAGQPVDVQLYTREILSARRRLIGGFYAYDNNARVTKLAARCSGVSNAQGLVECTLEPGVSGEVIAVATTRDRDGNEARAVTSVYLAGDDDWWFGGDNGDRMDVIPESTSYKSGETARFQVRMPFRDATALVTVEREGVLSSFVTQLSGKDPVVEVKMDGSYAPDVYVSVLAVRGRVAGWRLWLAEFAKKWHLPFLGGDPSEPTAIVDLAKPAYRLGMARVKVGWEGHKLDVQVKPARETFHVRDKAEVAVQVTGPGGAAPADAEIAFAAVDEGLLALSPNDSWDLLDAMMQERPISVLTSTAQMQVVGKRHYGRKALAAGGGGGGDLSSLARSDFRPLLLWKGRVPLDANGRATVTVPLADALSSYKLVAIATAGGQLFGTGSATIRTVQDLGIYAGLPPLVRSGDQYDALFTLRNSTGKDLRVTATASVSPSLGELKPQTVTVPAGGAAPVSWRVTAPEVASLSWTVSASVAGGGASDRVTVDEQVVPPVPEEVWAATFLRMTPGLRVPLAPPDGALPGRGGIEVALTASPAPSLTGVRDYMRAYPYGCFEQRLSKAVALGDTTAWTQQMADLPAYVSDDGLLRYWPGPQQPGSIALTAYALSITAEAGLPWPQEAKARLLGSLQSVVDGRLTEQGQGPADARLLRVAALAALARNGASTAAMAGRVAMPLRDLPTASLADWLTILDRTPGLKPNAKAAAEQELRKRIVYEGTRLDLVDRANAPWWMMVSGDEMALKALLAVTGRPGWVDEAPRMMIGAALRQQRGHWDTTPANAWGTIAVRRFAAAFPGVPTGITTGTLGPVSLQRNWPAPAPMTFPLPAQPTSLFLAHNGAAQPWAFVSVRAAVPLTAPSFAGYRVSREVSFLVRKDPRQVSRGDVMKVRITVQAPVDRTWVVVEDPLPAGASVVGGGGGQSALLAEKANPGEGGWPSYVERSQGVWRAYYGWLPSGRTSVEYVVRINSTGRFQLPPTHVEAMYSPEIRASLPNAPLQVVP